MALVKINSPSDAPIAIADWYKINAVLQTIGNGIGGGSRVNGSHFPRGAVLFYAGAWYIADADTAITGTASKYVKVTNTAGVLSLSFVANITGVTWNKSYQGYYDASTNMYLFDEVVAYGDGIIETLYSVINSRMSLSIAKVFSSLSTNYKKLLRPIGKTILTVGTGTYTVPSGVYSIEFLLQGPGNDGESGNIGKPYGDGGSSGSSVHEVIEVIPGQTITWTVSASTTTFGTYSVSKGGGLFGERAGANYVGSGGGEGGGRSGGRTPVAHSGGGGAGGNPTPQTGATGRIEIW